MTPRTAYDRAIEAFAGSRVGAWMFVHVFTYVDRILMRASGGRVSSGIGSSFHPSGILLQTRGAKSGKPRSVPLVSLRRGEELVIIASAGGQARNPAWYHNLKQHPEATVLLASGERIAVRAREAVGAERDELYDQAIAFSTSFMRYRERASRKIPVIVLSRR
jgi:deazaflavin-dependent oxidoreductase (nitroreductase family)